MPARHDHWHLDEMVVTIGGKRQSLWRAFDNEGEVLVISPSNGRVCAVRR
jgi:putative transposase